MIQPICPHGSSSKPMMECHLVTCLFLKRYCLHEAPVIIFSRNVHLRCCWQKGKKKNTPIIQRLKTLKTVSCALSCPLCYKALLNLFWNRKGQRAADTLCYGYWDCPNLSLGEPQTVRDIAESSPLCTFSWGLKALDRRECLTRLHPQITEINNWHQ